jgi:WD40 repeat protein
VTALAVSTGLVWRANQRLRAEVYFQRITVAHRELSTDNLAAALRALEECPEDLRGWEWHYLMRLCKVEPLVLRDSTEVSAVAFSPDGERFASAGIDGKIKIWDRRTGQKIQDFRAHDKAVSSVVFHPDGRYIATAGADRLVKVWDLAAINEPLFQGPCDAIRGPGAGYTVAFRPPDGRHLAAGNDFKVRVWDWKKNRPDDPVHILRGPESHSIPVAFTPDGRRLATDGQKGPTLWDAETGKYIRTFPADRHLVTGLAFSTDGGRLASASMDRSVKLWDTATGECLQTLPHSGNVGGVAFTPDGRRLATVGEDKRVHIWDVATGREVLIREVLSLRGHTDKCGCVAFSPDGWRLASASNDKTIRVWDATPLRGDEGQETLTFPQDDEVRSVAVSPQGERIVSAGNGTFALVWDAATHQRSFEFASHRMVVFAAAWHPNGRRIATAGSDGREHSVKVWDASDGRELDIGISVGRDSSSGPFQAVAFSPDGRYLVTGKSEGAVQVWDAETGQKVQVLGARTDQESNTFAAHGSTIRALVFSRDGKQFVSASSDGEVKPWDGTRLNEKQEPRFPLQARVPGPSVNVGFSPDGRRLATGDEKNKVKICNAQTGEMLQVLEGEHSAEVYTLAFSPLDDGRLIATAGEDSAVKIWDSHTGKLIRNFRGHMGLVSSLAFTRDGSSLVSGSRDKTVKVWDMTQLNEVAER